jgi:gluconate 2-dehydrogenase gamma chain
VTTQEHTPQTLTARQYRTVEAAAARILPTTDTPGATEAGVVVYIDRALTEAYTELAPLYREGCRALDRHARRRANSLFKALQPDAQDAILTEFEAGNAPDFRRAALFFTTLRKHTMEGFLGEPAYGGNQGLVGWKLVGFPGHQYGYDDAYINREVDIDPVAVDKPYRTEAEWRANAR